MEEVVSPLENVSKANSLVPRIDEDMLSQAIEALGPKLVVEGREKFHQAIQSAFDQYFRTKIWDEFSKSATASSVARELDGIAKKARKLVQALDFDDKKTPKTASYLCLSREADLYAEKNDGFSELPPKEFVAVNNHDGNQITRKDYRGDEKLQQIFRDIDLLAELADSAHEYERQKIEKEKAAKKSVGKNAKAQRGQDEAMNNLSAAMIKIWIEHFDQMPAGSRPGGEKEIGGPYIRFMKSLFDSLHDKTPKEIDGYLMGLRNSLFRTEEAIYHSLRGARLTMT